MMTGNSKRVQGNDGKNDKGNSNSKYEKDDSTIFSLFLPL